MEIKTGDVFYVSNIKTYGFFLPMKVTFASKFAFVLGGKTCYGLEHAEEIYGNVVKEGYTFRGKLVRDETKEYKSVLAAHSKARFVNSFKLPHMRYNSKNLDEMYNLCVQLKKLVV